MDIPHIRAQRFLENDYLGKLNQAQYARDHSRLVLGLVCLVSSLIRARSTCVFITVISYPFRGLDSSTTILSMIAGQHWFVR